MIRFYSVFVTCDEIMSSPYIRELSGAHDFTLRLGEPEIVNFLLQYRIPTHLQDQLCVIYEPDLLHLERIDTERFENQTLITVSVTPKEMGSMKIGFTFPTTKQSKRMSDRKLRRLYFDSVNTPDAQPVSQRSGLK